MSGLVGSMRRGGSAVGHGLGRFWTGINAVAIKELRSRMRGRRAFVVVTVYLLLLSLFAFAIYHYVRQQAVFSDPTIGVPPIRGDIGWVGSPGTALSASVGHTIFSGLLLLETLLVMILAPAFTAGAISLEREKQTLELLVATPLSTLGMVVGKLISALAYVFLLIIASIPLASLVFVFGAVGPEDLVRGYVLLFALAFGMGAVGMFISALVKRTQTATVLTFVLVFVLSIGTFGVHMFWAAAARSQSASDLIVTQRAGRAPEAVLWLNPFVADVDLVCITAPEAYHITCQYISMVTGRPYFGSSQGLGPGDGIDLPMPVPQPIQPDMPGGAEGADILVRLPAVDVECGPDGGCKPIDQDIALDEEPVTTITLGFPRDTFWPKSAAAFFGLGLILTFASAQLVAPTRRLRLTLPRLRRRQEPAASAAVPTADVDDNTGSGHDSPAEPPETTTETAE